MEKNSLDFILEQAPAEGQLPWPETIAVVLSWVRSIPVGQKLDAMTIDGINRARRTLAACQAQLGVYVGECKRIRNENADDQRRALRDEIAEAIYQAGRHGQSGPTDADISSQDIEGKKPSPVVVIPKISYERAKALANSDQRVKVITNNFAYWDAEWVKANKLFDAVTNCLNALSGDASHLASERKYINWTQAIERAEKVQINLSK
jgi:hypothetical protein